MVGWRGLGQAGLGHAHLVEYACEIASDSFRNGGWSVWCTQCTRRHFAPCTFHLAPPAGFLSENASFVEAVEGAGATFVGPPTYAVEKMGDKVESKKFAAAAQARTCPLAWMGQRR